MKRTGTSRRVANRPVAVAVDVAVVGTGLVGATLACALARSGLTVAAIDRAAPADLTDAAFDGRASSIALSSSRMLEAIGLWPRLAPHACPIHDIRVSDGRVRAAAAEGTDGRAGTSRFFLHYDHRDIGDAPLGFMLPNVDLRRGLDAALGAAEAVTRLAPAEIASVERDDAGVRIVLRDGREVHAPVLAAVDGRQSTLRREAGIRVNQWRYRQDAIVGAIAHDEEHGNVAHEHFLPGGPFAILPLPGRRSAFVWTDRPEVIAAAMRLDATGFDRELARRIGDFLGKVRSVGRRWRHPLGALHAARYVDRRMVLVGDAAHAMHPIAGQGLNMGLRDVAVLTEVLVEQVRLGLDPGAPDALRRYARWRRFDNMAMLGMTDGLNRLFSTDLLTVRLARDVGMGAVNRIGPLKRLFMRHAMGTVGELPRLLRGEPA
ncbi:MAG: UbiH/UbiF/VisC/COQ6 family ubiquinone biosynthesis hydroxylase [Acetobacterales bacterium]